MNLYDEAIENLRSVMAKFIIPNVEVTDYGCLYDLCHFYNSLDDEENKWLESVKKALERAKKVEKELEEYKISDKSKEESSIEYYNLYKETKRKLKKVEELLEFYKQLGGIEQDIEYLCGLRDCMIEHSLEKPMGHIYIGIKEYKEKRDGLNYQIKKLEEELK